MNFWLRLCNIVNLFLRLEPFPLTNKKLFLQIGNCNSRMCLSYLLKIGGWREMRIHTTQWVFRVRRSKIKSAFLGLSWFHLPSIFVCSIIKIFDESCRAVTSLVVINISVVVMDFVKLFHHEQIQGLYFTDRICSHKSRTTTVFCWLRFLGMTLLSLFSNFLLWCPRVVM